ncbi:MAG: S1C family serine protease [candidate division Zixibacteria bacterium]|nr:S1C family serine protease [candidate division Zixibacteria bacterium]
MLKTRLKAAAGILSLTLGAVFFSSAAYPSDSSLFNLESGLNDLVYRLTRSVVTVESSHSLRIGVAQGAQEESVHNLISSGIIYDSTGHVLVEASSLLDHDRIIVKYGNYILPARLVGIDYQTNVAVLKVDRPLGTAVRLADQYGCAGRMVIAVGNAYGMQASPSIGFCAGFRPDGTIQFSGPITSGTIGGGLFDLAGNLVGIITGGIGEGRMAEVGLAVPAYKIPAIVEHIVNLGDRQAGYIGITTADIEIVPAVEISSPFRLTGGRNASRTVINKALLVTAVVPSSPADRSGLRKGDLIFGVDGRELDSARDLMNLVQQGKPGTRLELSLIRQNAPLYAQLVIGQKRLTPSTRFLRTPGASGSTLDIPDSLQREITVLKQMIQNLETRLESLR